MFEYGDVVRLRNVRLAITMDGGTWTAAVNANAKPVFAQGTKGFADYGTIARLRNEPLVPSGDPDYYPGGGRWFVDAHVDLDIDVAEGERVRVEYGEVVRLRNEPLVGVPVQTGDAFTLTALVSVTVQFAQGQFADFASDPFGVPLLAALALDFDAGQFAAAQYTPEDLRADQFAAETGSVLALLLTLSHPDWAEPVRISTDPTVRLTETTADVIYGTLSRGQPYYFLPLQITLPSQTEEGPLRMRMVMDNVSRDLVAALRSLHSPPSVDVELIGVPNPHQPIASWPQFLLVNVDYNAETISGELVLETLFHEPFPAGTFTPSEFPSLH